MLCHVMFSSLHKIQNFKYQFELETVNEVREMVFYLFCLQSLFIYFYNHIYLLMFTSNSQCIDLNTSLKDFQKRMYSAQYMTLAVISRGKTN